MLFRSYKTEAVAYYTKYIYAHDTKKKLYQINIVAYEPGTSFWPVTGPQQVDYNKTHYFAKIELSSLEYKTLMEVKTAADIKLAEQKAKDLWEGKYTTPIQEDKDKEDIMAGLEELDAKNRIYLEFYNTKSLEELIELVEKYRYVLRNFHEHEKVDSISNYIAGLNHELWLAIAWANIYIKRKGGILDWNPNLSGVVGAYKLAVSNYDEFLAKKSQKKKEINESDKEDILAGLGELNVDPNEPVNQKSIRKLGFEEIPSAVFNNYFHIPEDKDLRITLAFIQSEPHSKVVLYPGKWYVWGESTRLYPVTTLGDLQNAYRTLKTKIQQRIQRSRD